MNVPEGTLDVLAGSTFRLETAPFVFVKASAVRTPSLHRMIAHDERETTVATTRALLDDVDVVEENADEWALFTIDCANPFYCVGFIATIANALVAEGLDILAASTFTRDLIWVKWDGRERARTALGRIGLTEA